ncbi:MAG: CBS domain-containing protein [Desulfobacteraceae bacterium]|nr:MAG: CBS domain-containing protein [Desulfobacteraceae bacterium]
MKTVKEILKIKNKDIYSVAPTATVFDALKLMGEKGIGALMVMEGGEAVGIISERDYARKVILKGKTSRDTLVKEIMTSNMFSVKPQTTVEECMVLITGKRIRHVPVFDQGKFVGIISIGDVVKSIIAQQEMLIEQLSSYIAGKYI